VEEEKGGMPRFFLPSYRRLPVGAARTAAGSCCFSQVQNRTSEPSALLQSATSATLPLFGLTSRNQPLSVSTACRRSQVLFHQVYCWMLARSTVPRSRTSSVLSLGVLTMRLVPPDRLRPRLVVNFA
jgi:hypothetical protein